MKIVIFGATGGTGQELIAQGLKRGLEITAFVRDGAKQSTWQGLRTVTGSVYNAEQVASAIVGQGAVLSALGARTLGKSDLLEHAMPNIVAGMKRNGVKRVIALGAAGAISPARALQHQGWLYRNMGAFFVGVMLKNPMASQRVQHALIEASGLDYTIVEPPRLINRPATGRIRVQEDGLAPGIKATPRADVATFMLRQLDDPTWVRKTPYVGV